MKEVLVVEVEQVEDVDIEFLVAMEVAAEVFDRASKHLTLQRVMEEARYTHITLFNSAELRAYFSYVSSLLRSFATS